MVPGADQAICPRCGSSTNVRTVQELFDVLNSLEEGARQKAAQAPPPPETHWEPKIRREDDPWQNRPDQQLANDVLGAAGHFIGKAIGNRVQRTMNNRVMPALEDQAPGGPAAQQEQAAIIERYPQMRGCLHDQVFFMVGGTSVVPISDLKFPVTVAKVDVLAQRLASG